jgi:DNA repair exonuclease SbcCD ATPase subunit
MKFAAPLKRWSIPVLSVLLLFTIIAWNNNQQVPQQKHIKEDTVPKSKSGRLPGDKDLDKELRELEKARLEVEKLKDFDFEKFKKEMDESMKELDVEKMKADIEKSIDKDVMINIERELKKAMAEIDLNKVEIDKEMKKAMEEVKGLDLSDQMDRVKEEMEKAKFQLDKELKSKDWEKEMKKIKEIDMKEMEKEMENARKEIERSKADLDLEKLNMKDEMDNARKEIDKAKEELKGYQEMIYSMEKAGLLSTKGDYTIQYKDGELFINGKKQSAEVTEKYKKYFKKDTTIKKEDGDFNIDID